RVKPQCRRRRRACRSETCQAFERPSRTGRVKNAHLGGEKASAYLGCAKNAAVRERDMTFVRYGSGADITRSPSNVRFTPKRTSRACPGMFASCKERTLVQQEKKMMPPFACAQA